MPEKVRKRPLRAPHRTAPVRPRREGERAQVLGATDYRRQESEEGRR